MIHFHDKNMTEFWNAWSAKLNNRNGNNKSEIYIIINESNNPALIADSFMAHFESVYYDSKNSVSAVQERNECVLPALHPQGS